MRDLKRLGTGNANMGRRRSLTGKERIGAVLRHYERYRAAGRLPATYEVIYAHARRPEHSSVPRRAAEISIPVSAVRRRA
jgi:malonyl-CoA O-methyltransferase